MRDNVIPIDRHRIKPTDLPEDQVNVIPTVVWCAPKRPTIKAVAGGGGIVPVMFSVPFGDVLKLAGLDDPLSKHVVFDIRTREVWVK
jgi:hypothetical protein